MKNLLFMTAAVLLVVVQTGLAKSGEVRYDLWFDIGGGDISNLTGHVDYPDNPDATEVLTTYEKPDLANTDNFGAQFTGWITPPQTGEYQFFIASDDDGELWLSPNANPDDAVRIADVDGWCAWRDFSGTSGSVNPRQDSAPQLLQAGRKYYLMARYTDGGQGGFCSVAWSGPGITAWTAGGTAGIFPAGVVGDLIQSEYIASDPWGRHKATDPSPPDGVADINDATNLMLTWQPPVFDAGGPIVRYDLYFGDSAAVGDPNTGVAPTATIIPNAGNTNLNHVISAAQLSKNKTYYWRVDTIVNPAKPVTDPNNENAVGDLWSFSTLRTLPTITQQPVGATVWPGEQVVFTVGAVGDPAAGTIRYQWQRNGVDLAGQTEPTLTIPSVTYPDDEGTYSCVVRNDAGPVSSAVVRLKIKRLIAWYKLDDDLTVSKTVTDSSPNGYHGQANGNVTSVPGVIGGAFSFDGSSGWVDTLKMPSAIGLSGNESRTITAWVYTREFNGGGIYDMGTQANTQTFSLRTLTDDNLWRIQYYGGDTDFTTTGIGNGKNVGSYNAPTKNVWAHFVHAHGPGGTKIHLNGRLIVDWVGKTVGTTDGYTFRIGAYGNISNYFNGIIDDVQVYNFAMNELEAAQLYTQVRPEDKICLGNPVNDLNGDCIVSLADLAVFASDYLACNWVPDCKP
ncbi:MAG TPA: PA14 domain-containing protein [Anaerohalosphaeraceae bacterium]|nr:PA14 domain-containing protein [Anaerohalosphaeraceae bacterium]HRT50083.1 PA14 domain-containing protein [Anaerohalosphaeraceae bacterium]HRT86017.1 PA14 domain-containing protein [Anaerohalosphaeraceae bacterium]